MRTNGNMVWHDADQQRTQPSLSSLCNFNVQGTEQHSALLTKLILSRAMVVLCLQVSQIESSLAQSLAAQQAA